MSGLVLNEVITIFTPGKSLIGMIFYGPKVQKIICKIKQKYISTIKGYDLQLII